MSHIWWQRWDPLPASRQQGPLVDAASASEQSSVEARATANNRVRVAKRVTAAEEEREGQRETCQGSVSHKDSKGRYWSEFRKRARSAERAKIAASKSENRWGGKSRCGKSRRGAGVLCMQRGGMCCHALLEGACVAWHPEGSISLIPCIAVSQGDGSKIAQRNLVRRLWSAA